MTLSSYTWIEHTERNFFKSFPDAMSLSTAKPWLIATLSSETALIKGSSGITTCGICGADLHKQWEVRNDPGTVTSIHLKDQNMQAKWAAAHFFMKVLAVDHKNRPTRARIKPWQSNVTKLYSNTSNNTQAAVAPPRTPAETFLSLHRKTSAAAHTWDSCHYICKSLTEIIVTLFWNFSLLNPWTLPIIIVQAHLKLAYNL